MSSQCAKCSICPNFTVLWNSKCKSCNGLLHCGLSQRFSLVVILRTLVTRKKKKDILLSYNLNTDSDTLKKKLSSVFSEPYISTWQGTDFFPALRAWVILLSGDVWENHRRRLTENWKEGYCVYKHFLPLT